MDQAINFYRCSNKSETAVIADDKHIRFRGERMALTKAAKILAKEAGKERQAIDGPYYWTFDGVRLTELCKGREEKQARTNKLHTKGKTVESLNVKGLIGPNKSRTAGKIPKVDLSGSGKLFQVYGPFQINRIKFDDPKYQKSLWDDIDKKCDQLSQAKGIYLLSLRNGKNYTPVYVGKTKSLGFKIEVFTSHKQTKIAKLAEKSGALYVHLLAKPKTKQSGFSKHIESKQLDWLERIVLWMCLRKNPGILNKNLKPFLKKVEIEGVTGKGRKGKPGADFATFLNAVGLSRRHNIPVKKT